MKTKQEARETAPGTSVPHESAALHVAGEASYVDDIPELAGTCYIALGLSEQAHAEIKSIDLEAVKAAVGVIAVITAADIPGKNDCGPIIADDPILADGLVQYVGQPVFAVVADSQTAARKAAKLASIEYEALPAVLDIASGKQQQSWVLPPMQLRRGDADSALAQAQHKMKGGFTVGGQEQFYLEGQISYVAPKEDGCFHLWCSTQHPTEMQQVVAHALNRDFNQVVVETRRMGGGFGGKESQSAMFACIASVSADGWASRSSYGWIGTTIFSPPAKGIAFSMNMRSASMTTVKSSLCGNGTSRRFFHRSDSTCRYACNLPCR